MLAWGSSPPQMESLGAYLFAGAFRFFFVRALGDSNDATISGGVLPLGLTRGFGASYALRHIAIPVVSHYPFETLAAHSPRKWAV